jgi:uncharacterized protein (DUF1330 family)
MTAYIIVNYQVEDADQYKTYQKGAAPALGIGSDCKLRVLEHNSEALEGDPGSNTVVLEFESREKAKEIWDSQAYRDVVDLRLGASSKHFAVLVDSFEMPS